MASGTILSFSHSLRMVTAISLPPWYTKATTPVARSSSCISCGVVAGFMGTHVCLSMTERSTDMSSGPLGTATPTREPAWVTPHVLSSSSTL